MLLNAITSLGENNSYETIPWLNFNMPVYILRLSREFFDISLLETALNFIASLQVGIELFLQKLNEWVSST